MSLENATQQLAEFGLASRILTFTQSSATVELAAQAVGCEPAHIAKTLSFVGTEDNAPILIVTAGDAKIDNQKFKQFFGIKAKMLAPEQVEQLVGHQIGGVCPFGVLPAVRIYTDISLKRFPIIYPAAGTAASAVRLTCEELFTASRAIEWIDVCKAWQE